MPSTSERSYRRMLSYPMTSFCIAIAILMYACRPIAPLDSTPPVISGPHSANDYAESPLTPWAQEITELVLSADRGASASDLPRSRFLLPVEGALWEGPHLDSADRPTLLLVRASVCGSECFRLALALSTDRMTLLQLEPRAPVEGRPAGEALELLDAVRYVQTRILDGTVAALTARARLEDFAAVPSPDASVLEQFGSTGEMRLIAIDDLALRTPAGHLLELRISETQDGFRFASDPLVRVTPL